MRLYLARPFLGLLDTLRPDVQDLELDFRDPTPCPSHPGRDVAGLTVERRRLTLQRQQPMELAQSLIEQLALGRELAGEEP